MNGPFGLSVDSAANRPEDFQGNWVSERGRVHRFHRVQGGKPEDYANFGLIALSLISLGTAGYFARIAHRAKRREAIAKEAELNMANRIKVLEQVLDETIENTRRSQANLESLIDDQKKIIDDQKKIIDEEQPIRDNAMELNERLSLDEIDLREITTALESRRKAAEIKRESVQEAEPSAINAELERLQRRSQCDYTSIDMASGDLDSLSMRSLDASNLSESGFSVATNAWEGVPLQTRDQLQKLRGKLVTERDKNIKLKARIKQFERLNASQISHPRVSQGPDDRLTNQQLGMR